MKFLMIDAAAKTVKIEDHRNLVMAEQALGLNPRAVDHGSFQKGLGYVVYEFGLFDPPERQNYFAVGRSLIAGNCVHAYPVETHSRKNLLDVEVMYETRLG